MPSSTVLHVSCAPLSRRAYCSYVGNLEVDRSVRVKDVVEEVAVVVVASEFGLKRRLELERRRGGLQLGVDVLVATNRGHAVELLHTIVLHLLTVLVGHDLLLGVRAILVPAHIDAIVCSACDGRLGCCGRASRIVDVGVVIDEGPRLCYWASSIFACAMLGAGGQV